MNNDEAEIIRKKYRYRKLILSGKLKISFENAKKIIGPDRIYQLYSKKKKRDKG